MSIPALSVTSRPSVDAAAPPSVHLGGASRRSAAPQVASLLGWEASLVRLAYLWRHGRLPNLVNPERFTELVQHRKLFDRDPRFPALIDKVAVKRFVAAELGPAWVTPTLWAGSILPEAPSWSAPFVVKSRHGCNQRLFVRSGQEDWSAVRRTARGWMRSSYGRWLAEWGYRDVPRGLLVEPFLGCPSRLPVDYKIYVFHGRAAFVQVHVGREHDHRWALFDREWRPVSRNPLGGGIAPPRSLPRMIAAAETLGARFAFVRTDFYDLDGAPRFGEMTFYPGSGLDPFDPDALDVRLGRLWTDEGSTAGRSRAAFRS